MMLDKLRKEYKHKLILNFKTKEALENFTAYWLDGGGEQNAVMSTNCDEPTWNNKPPELFIEDYLEEET
jgi:hypothetical protein